MLIICTIVGAIDSLNGHCGRVYDYEPLGWENTLGVFLCVCVGLLGVLLAGEGALNLVMGIGLGILGYLLILQNIAKKTTIRVALGASVLLLILAAVGVAVVAVTFMLAAAGVERRQAASTRKALDDMYGR